MGQTAGEWRLGTRADCQQIAAVFVSFERNSNEHFCSARGITVSGTKSFRTQIITLKNNSRLLVDKMYNVLGK